MARNPASTAVTVVRSTSTGLSQGLEHRDRPLDGAAAAITDDDCIVPPEWLRTITAPAPATIPRSESVSARCEPVP